MSFGHKMKPTKQVNVSYQYLLSYRLIKMPFFPVGVPCAMLWKQQSAITRFFTLASSTLRSISLLSEMQTLMISIGTVTICLKETDIARTGNVLVVLTV